MELVEYVSNNEVKQANDKIDEERRKLGNEVPPRILPCPNNAKKVWVLWYGSYILVNVE